MKRFLTLLVLPFLFAGCEPQSATDKVEVTPKVAPSTNQLERAIEFTITSKGTFKAGYDNETREILLIKDNKTGVEYIAITDCSLIRRVKAKAEAASDAVDSALDAISSFDTE